MPAEQATQAWWFSLDADVAVESEHFKATVRDLSTLAERSLSAFGHVATLAWLRRLNRELEGLHAHWSSSLPPQRPLPQRRRDDRRTGAQATARRHGDSTCIDD
jgi:hypothetical protein